MQNQNKWSFGENSRLRCFVANFIADGFTRFLCYFFWAKSAFVLFFTLLECLVDCQHLRFALNQVENIFGYSAG